MPRKGAARNLRCQVRVADSLCPKDELVLRRILLKLYHIEQELQEHAQAIRTQNQTLAGLREEQRKHEQELEAARAEQARARSSVMQKEKRIKKAEKALEGKVCTALCLARWPVCSQRRS